MKKTLISFILTLFCASVLSAQQLRLPTVLGDGMVLQQNENVNIWGWAKPSAKVSVKAQWLDEEVMAKAGEDGKWLVSLATPAGSYEKYTIAVESGKSEIVLKDVLIGEVWLCSGQSNMAWKVEQTLDLKAEMKAASELAKNLRIYSTGRIEAETPQDDVADAKWQECTPQTVASFSAVGYGFGLELQKALDVPVGLIQAAYGGTLLEGWVSAETIRSGEKAANLQRSVKLVNKEKGKWAGKESVLWNANISPILNTRIAGVIWYQGCSNVRINPVSYRETLQGLISSWRREFNNPEMPFYIAQIAPHTYDNQEGALLRESQAYVAAMVQNCELVVTNDCQEIPGDIHPRLKRNVFHRLALCALGQHYKKDFGPYRSPAFDRIERAGSEVRIHFKNVPSSLVAEGEKVIGFQIGQRKGETIEYVLADARIDESGKCVILSAEGVQAPTDARYCFDESVGNVFSAEGLPLCPFRTDRKKYPIDPSARAYIEPAVATPVVFEGEGYEKAVFEEGAQLWTDSKMLLSEGFYPKEFEGYQIMITTGVAKGETSKGGKMIAKADGRMYFLARMDRPTRKMWYRGWRMIHPSEVTVRRVVGENEDGTPKYKELGGLFIHYKDVKKGDEFELQTTDSWVGVIPMASSIKYVE